MKNVLFSLTAAAVFVLASCSSSGDQPKTDSIAKKDTVAADPNAYDSLLAKKLGADEYGMHGYVMAFLHSGPTPEKDSVKREAMQKAHLANIQRMADEGKLSIAGPFLDGGEIRGIYIFNVATVEEAQALTATDPWIKSGGLVMELHPWYGSAALQQLPDMHKRVQKKSIF